MKLLLTHEASTYYHDSKDERLLSVAFDVRERLEERTEDHHNLEEDQLRFFSALHGLTERILSDLLQRMDLQCSIVL